MYTMLNLYVHILNFHPFCFCFFLIIFILLFFNFYFYFFLIPPSLIHECLGRFLLSDFGRDIHLSKGFITYISICHFVCISFYLWRLTLPTTHNTYTDTSMKSSTTFATKSKRIVGGLKAEEQRVNCKVDR